MEYQTFEVTVDARSDGRYEVRSRSPNGESLPSPCPPIGADELARHRDDLVTEIERSRAARDIVINQGAQSAGSRLGTARTIGTSLFNLLFTGPVLEAYRSSLALARLTNTGLRLQLRVHPAELVALPWEFLFDPKDRAFVALNPVTPVVRYPEVAIAPKPLAIELPLRVLVMMASPTDLQRLDVEGERRRINEALGPLRDAGKVEVGLVPSGSYSDLQQILRQGEWHVFHFVGHGGFDDSAAEEGGMLAFESRESRRTHRVSGSTLGPLLQAHTSLRLVVLNSCLGARGNDADAFSSVAATLIHHGIPAVVAMQYEISDHAALAFAQSFYTGLAAAVPVDRAVAEARAEMKAARDDSLEWGTPVLLLRAPEGKLFATSAAAGKVTPRPSRPVAPPIVPPTPPPSRVPGTVLVVALVLPVLLAAALALIHRPVAWMKLDADLTGFSMITAKEWNIGEEVPVTEAGISGLDRIVLTGGEQGVQTIDSDALLLRSSDSSSSSIRLKLDPLLPAGSKVSLTLADGRPGYVLKTDSLQTLGISLGGPVAVAVPGTLQDTIDFGESGSAALKSGGHTLRVAFALAHGADSVLTTRLPIRSLDLSRVDQYVSGESLDPRSVSTVRHGSLTLDQQTLRPLAPGQMVLTGSTLGSAAIVFRGDRLGLHYEGEVRELAIATDEDRQNLMPTMLRWLMETRGWWLIGGLVAYLVSLGLLPRRLLWKEA
jgi:hypothetical protein